MRCLALGALLAISGCGAFGGGEGDHITPADDAGPGTADGAPTDGAPADGTPADGGADASEQCTDITTQKLHCGACGHSCLGGLCVGGKCQPVALVSGETNPYGIAVDGTYVYWTRYVNPGGAVMRAAKASPGTAQVFEGAQSGPRAIAVSGGSVYWTTDGSGSAGQIQAEADNNDHAILNIDNQDHPTALAVSKTAVYWSLRGDGGPNSGAIRLANLGLSQRLEKVGSVTLPSAVTADAEWLYYGSEIPEAYVKRAGLPFAGNEACLDKPSTYVRALALLGSYVYWTTAYGLRRTTRAPFATGSITDIDSTASTVGLVADGTAIYFVAADGSVRRYAEGGPPVLLANGPVGALFIAQDDAAVYWTAAADGSVGAGSIMMLAKPPK